MYLSYSGYQNAEGCRYRYWHSYIAHTPPPKPEDRLGSVYGTVVGRLFETFYANEMWRRPGSSNALTAMAGTVVDAVLDEEVKPKKGRAGGVIVWRREDVPGSEKALYASREELISDVQAAIPRGLATIKAYRFLGRNAKAELKLDTDIEGHRVGGRADFVMTRIPPHGDLVIVDGKGSRRRGRYADELQLRWYSMLFNERYGRLPDRTAFVYWHFDPPSNVDWCTVNPTDVDKLKGKVVKVIKDLDASSTKVGSSKSLPLIRSVFMPSAQIANCRFCSYATEELCPQGLAVVLKESQRVRT